MNLIMRWPLRYQIMVPMAAVMLLAVLFVEGVGALLAVRDAESQIAAQIHEVAHESPRRQIFRSPGPCCGR